MILVADATASGINKHHDTTLERVIDYWYVTHLLGLEEMIKILVLISSGQIVYKPPNERISRFLEKHKLIGYK